MLSTTSATPSYHRSTCRASRCASDRALGAASKLASRTGQPGCGSCCICLPPAKTDWRHARAASSVGTGSTGRSPYAAPVRSTTSWPNSQTMDRTRVSVERPNLVCTTAHGPMPSCSRNPAVSPQTPDHILRALTPRRQPRGSSPSPRLSPSTRSPPRSMAFVKS